MKTEPSINALAAVSTSILDYSLKDGRAVRSAKMRDGRYLAHTANPPRTSELLASSAEDIFLKRWLESDKKPQSNSDILFKVVDLFSGCGGMSLGIEEACRAFGMSAEHVYAAEIEPIYAEVYAQNFKPKMQHVGSVTDVFTGELGSPITAQEQGLAEEIGSVDLLCGGPPCQGHSDLNNYTRRHDPRNSLYDRMARAAEVLLPSAILIENVPGVKRDRTGVFERTVLRLQELGYEIEVLTLDAADFGIPQHRKRAIVVAVRGADRLTHFKDTLSTLQRSAHRPCLWAFSDLSEANNEFDRSSVLSDESLKRASWLFENNMYELPDSMRPDCHRLKSHSYKSVYGRMYEGLPAPTITTGCLVMGQGRFLHPKEPRTITPHEAARLQTFPDYFDFGTRKRTAYAKMIGNAVPPLFSFSIACGLVSY